MQIRGAIEADIDEITAIYNEVLTHSTAIYNDTPVPLEDRLTWWRARIDQGYPVVVAKDDDRVVVLLQYWICLELKELSVVKKRPGPA
jgi:phosphinothricin acetyltransferase